MLKTLRRDRKLTQAQLAKRAKISQPYLSYLEQGKKTNPRLVVIRRLAVALDTTTDEVIKALSAQGRRRATR